MVQREEMPSFTVETTQRRYQSVVERGVLARVGEYVPAKAGTIFVVTTDDVWRLHGGKLKSGLNGRGHEVLRFEGGETRKRLWAVEQLADEMLAKGADRTSVVIGFGGGIVTDICWLCGCCFYARSAGGASANDVAGTS